MKKLLTILCLAGAVVFCTIKASALTFIEAVKLQKPCAVLIYADWADDAQDVMKSFKSKEQQWGSKYNFVAMNIADEQTKEFNKLYHIYPNLPYVLLFKDKGKVSRLLKKECVTTSSCFDDKLDLFAD